MSSGVWVQFIFCVRLHGTCKGCHHCTTLGQLLTVYSRSPIYRGTRACPCHARNYEGSQKLWPAIFIVSTSISSSLACSSWPRQVWACCCSHYWHSPHCVAVTVFPPTP